MKRWEYAIKVIEFDFAALLNTQNKLNLLGTDGWELVSVFWQRQLKISGRKHFLVILKKPK